MLEILKLLPDGASALAVIIVVMLFLKQQERANAILQSITKGFNDQVAESQKAFQEQVQRLTQQQYENHKAHQEQAQSLIEAHVKVSRETITALKALEASLKAAKERGFHKVGGGQDRG